MRFRLRVEDQRTRTHLSGITGVRNYICQRVRGVLSKYKQVRESARTVVSQMHRGINFPLCNVSQQWDEFP
jgi:hypothetical protein